MATKNHNLSDYDINSVPDATGMKIGIVVAEWNENITASLLEGAKECLAALNSSTEHRKC